MVPYDSREERLDYGVVRLSEQPELKEQFQQLHRAAWPEFLHHTVGISFEELYTTFADFQLVLRSREGTVVAIGQTIPLQWDGVAESLPAECDCKLLREQ